jgi:hypothetical protein
LNEDQEKPASHSRSPTTPDSVDGVGAAAMDSDEDDEDDNNDDVGVSAIAPDPKQCPRSYLCSKLPKHRGSCDKKRPPAALPVNKARKSPAPERSPAVVRKEGPMSATEANIEMAALLKAPEDNAQAACSLLEQAVALGHLLDPADVAAVPAALIASGDNDKALAVLCDLIVFAEPNVMDAFQNPGSLVALLHELENEGDHEGGNLDYMLDVFAFLCKNHASLVDAELVGMLKKLCIEYQSPSRTMSVMKQGASVGIAMEGADIESVLRMYDSRTKCRPEVKETCRLVRAFESVRCAVFDGNLHSMMPLISTPARLKRAGV